MTHAQRNAAILERISAYTAANTTSKEVAMAALIREGFYLSVDEVAPQFAPERDATNA